MVQQKNEDSKLKEILKKYEDKEDYGAKTRVKEIIDFCKKMNYKKVGLAFCVGLAKEANIFAQVLRNNEFEVESVICKLGDVNRENIGISGCNVPMCNPIAQAELLNIQKH